MLSFWFENVSNLYGSITKKCDAGFDLLSYKPQLYSVETPCYIVTSENLRNMDLKLFKFAALSGFAHTKLSDMIRKRDIYVITFGTIGSQTNMYTFNPVTSLLPHCSSSSKTCNFRWHLSLMFIQPFLHKPK